MPLWKSDATHGPTWAPNVRVPKGWAHARTGELLVAFGDTSYTEPVGASTIASIKIAKNKKKFKSGDTIKLYVQFTEPVKVTGTPQVALGIGYNSRTMNYIGRADSDDPAQMSVVTFEYLVVPADVAAAGLVTLGTAALQASKNILTSNAGITYTAVTGGTAGNSITVTYAVAGANTALSVSVASSAITVNVATNGSSAATSTAAQVLAAIKASAPASALVTGVLIGDGTGVVSAVSATNLTGGTAAAAGTAISLNSGTIQDIGSSVIDATLTYGAAAPDLTGVSVNV